MLRYKSSQIIFELLSLEPRLQFQPNFVCFYRKSSFKDKQGKVLHNNGNHLKKISVTEVFIKSLVLLCCMNVRF